MLSLLVVFDNLLGQVEMLGGLPYVVKGKAGLLSVVIGDGVSQIILGNSKS